MSYEFDHLFVFCPLDAPGAEYLLGCGFKEGLPNAHPGQGTRCRRFFFQNSYLELLWVQNENEVLSKPVKPMALWERSRHGQTGYSPFGLGLRPKPGGLITPPFPTWAYRPSYLPAGYEISVAGSASSISDPLIFVLPFGGRPDEYSSDRSQPLNHACGARKMTGIEITLASRRKSETIETMEKMGLVYFKLGTEPLAEIIFDDGESGSLLDCRPHMPIVLKW